MLDPLAIRRKALDDRFPQWEPRTIDQALAAAAAEFPDRQLVVTDDRSFTYREILDWSRLLAGGLVASGVRPGDHVAIVLANYPEFVAMSYAVSAAGATTVPINFLNRRDELGYVLRQSDAVLLVTMDRFRGNDYLAALDSLAPGWESAGGGEAFPKLREVVVFATAPAGGRAEATTLDALAARTPDEPTRPTPTPDQPAVVLYTSGTTGNPKGVLLTHDMLLRTAYGSAYHRGFQDGRSLLFSLPLYHVFGYVEGLLAMPFVGGAIIPQLSFDPAATLRGIERHRADDALFVPTMTLAVLEELKRTPYDVSSLTALFSSGGQSPDRIWQEILDLLGPEELVTGYGMSETTASTTCTDPGGPLEKLRTTNGHYKEVGVVGDPATDGRLAVYRAVDPETGHDVAPGEVGALICRGPGITSGYYRKPDETAAAFDDDGWFHTGDLGWIDAEGYLGLVGRLKDCYRCGGEQVVPKEIEDVLTAHPAVAQAHIVPLRDERMGEVGVAWVVFKDGTSAEGADLIAYCAERVARFKVPRHVLPITVAELPTTPSGRPRKFLLAERAARQLSTRP
jgi:fatty-acyl-CoA synthase